MLSLAVMRLLPAGGVIAGQVEFGGTDLSTLGPNELRAIRGARIGMVFQEPMTGLNPMLAIGFQIEEAIRAHEPRVPTRVAGQRALDMLSRVRMPDRPASMAPIRMNCRVACSRAR